LQPEEQQGRECVSAFVFACVCVVGGCWRLCEVFEVGVGWWLEVVAGGCCVRETNRIRTPRRPHLCVCVCVCVCVLCACVCVCVCV